MYRFAPIYLTLFISSLIIYSSAEDAGLTSINVRGIYDQVFAKDEGKYLDWVEVRALLESILGVKDSKQDSLSADEWKSVDKIYKTIILEDFHCSPESLVRINSIISQHYAYQVNVVPALRKRKLDKYTFCIYHGARDALDTRLEESLNELVEELWKKAPHKELPGDLGTGIWRFMERKAPELKEKRGERSFADFIDEYQRLVMDMCSNLNKKIASTKRIYEFGLTDQDLRFHLDDYYVGVMRKVAVCDMVKIGGSDLASKVWRASLPRAKKLAMALHLQ